MHSFPSNPVEPGGAEEHSSVLHSLSVGRTHPCRGESTTLAFSASASTECSCISPPNIHRVVSHSALFLFRYALLLLLGLLTLGCQFESSQRVFTSAEEVKHASANEALHGQDVEMEGVVTYSDPAWRLLFVQDDTGGLFVDPTQLESVPALGERVRLKGVVGPASVGIDSLRVETLGTGSLPSPATYSIADPSPQKHGERWVEVEGVVHEAEFQAGRLVLTLEKGAGHLLAQVRDPSRASYESLGGAQVQLRGVLQTHGEPRKDKVSGIQLQVPSLAHIRVVQSAGERSPDVTRVSYSPSTGGSGPGS